METESTPEKPMKVADFAEMVGVSRQAIYKAIREGRIAEGNYRNGMVIASIALKEYTGNTDISKRGYLGHGSPHRRAAEKAEQERQQAAAQPAHEHVPTADFHTAKKADMIYRAQLRKLQVEELSGKLVRKDEVYRELFSMGKEIRAAFQAIPDRIIDNLLACSTRAEAHMMLYKSIAETLEQLAGIEERPITQKK